MCTILQYNGMLKKFNSKEYNANDIKKISSLTKTKTSKKYFNSNQFHNIFAYNYLTVT